MRTRAGGLLVGIFILATMTMSGADPAPAGLPDAQSPDKSLPGIQAFAETRRFALVVGCNGGGPGRERLKYALSDARSFAAVMTELGGVRPSDLDLLLDPDLRGLDRAFAAIGEAARKATRAGQRSEFIFYYSGHSDETGLLLGPELLEYVNLRAEIEGVRADLRVAILDSCASGAMTRTKGGRPRPAFLVDESSDMKGHAYLTSSSAAESAQESDRLGGSFFTHYLVSGLRGAADSLGQGRVTLNEAYAYAFKETLASTESTRFGPQHPAYEINLTGTGDLVLTDLRSSLAGLLIAEDIQGKIYVRDARGVLAVELAKTRGKKAALGIPPGPYSLVVDDGESRYDAHVRVAEGSPALVAFADLKPMETSASVARGGGLVAAGAAAPDADGLAGAGPASRQSPLVSFMVLPDLKRAYFSSTVDRSLAFNALIGSTRELRGLEIAGIANTEALDAKGVQVAGIVNAALGSARGFQIGGLINYAGGDMEWAHVAGLANIAGGRFAGAQIAGLANISRTGRVLYAGSESPGYVGELPGAASGRDVGLELAALLNRSAALDGCQISLVNLATKLRGAQLGLVNVATEAWGLQLGLVNVAGRIHGPSIGLVSLEKGGILALEGTGDLGGHALTAFKIGTRFGYSVASLGVDSPLSPKEWNLALGLGLRLPLGPFFFDADAQWRSYFDEGGSWPSFVPESHSLIGRVLFGWRPGSSDAPVEDAAYALIGGVQAEMLLPGLSIGPDGSPSSSFSLSPGVFFGLQVRLGRGGGG